MFASEGKSVLVGLEIPNSEQSTIDQFIATGDESLLKSSAFFRTQFQDGRESAAMVDLLKSLRLMGRVRVVCFDIADHRKARDLGMAETFVNARTLIKPDVSITLSGNCHSKLSSLTACTPGEDPMGMSVLKPSSDLSLQSATSLDVRYESGSSWNAMSDYIGVHHWPKNHSPYAEAVAWDSYFLLQPPMTSDGYSGTFFFRTISASPPYVVVPRVSSTRSE